MSLAFITLIIAMVALSISHHLPSETSRIALSLPARFCLVLSFVLAPWSLKILIAIAAFVLPSCTQRYGMRRDRCSRLCWLRDRCAHP